ncbi:hypothetical protein REF28_01330 [Serratia marcescens]|uniref:hypothetical protein n=1 Tax=Serratia marcescens TaxID=615 RepID=UPI0038917373
MLSALQISSDFGAFLKKLIITAIMLTSFSSQADCWIVGDMKGQSQFAPDFLPQADEVAGKYRININGSEASVAGVDDVYNSGLTYKALSPISVLGTVYRDGSSFIETWTFAAGNKVIYTKAKANYSHLTQSSSFVGDVVGKCQPSVAE